MNKQLKIFTNGFIRENPLLVLNIGLCSSLGVTTSIFNGLGMGLGMTFVLLMSEIVISIFRKLIPSAIRLPIFIIIIAAFTTIVQLVLQAYVQTLYEALGVFLPLIVVNCIIMGRVEAFASKNNIGNSVLDALGMGLGYTLVLVLISFFRELLGSGTLTIWSGISVTLIPESYRIGIFNSAPGGFIVFGFLAALVQAFKQAVAAKKNKECPKPQEPSCGACKLACPNKVSAENTANKEESENKGEDK
ncbi:MAG: electron transport complex subunit RsxE [Treponema sp.]|nr:electron transport complex subunit RsxE [Treponema sp.]